MPKTCLGVGIHRRRKAEREDQPAKTRELIQAELDEMVADGEAVRLPNSEYVLTEDMHDVPRARPS